MSVGVDRRSNPNGISTPAARNTSRHPLLVPRSFSAGSTELSGRPSRTESVRSKWLELKHTMCVCSWLLISRRMRSIRRGRRRIFSERGRLLRSLQWSITNRDRAWLVGTPVSSAR
jgi:hypothetical protein